MPEWNRPKTGSFELFKSTRELSGAMLEAALKRPPIDVAKTVVQMETNAKASLAKYDLENGLIFYWRATNIGMEYLKITKLKKDDPIVKRIYAVVKYCLDESEKLNPVLENMFVKSSTAKTANGSITSIRTLSLKGKDYELISPRSIVHALSGGEKPNYLLIDTRKSYEEQVRFEPNDSLLTVLNLPKTIFPVGLTINNLVKVLPSQDKHKLSRLSEFNLVILMGNETEDDREALEGIVTALSTYNYTVKLQKEMCIMDGGFKSWKTFYPPYVSGVKKSPVCLDQDDLTDFIHKFRMNTRIADRSMYPDLSPPTRPPPSPQAATRPPIMDEEPPGPSTSTPPSLPDLSSYPVHGGPPIPREPSSIPTSSSSSSLSSIVYPTNLLPSSGREADSFSRPPPPPLVPNVPGRELKPLAQTGWSRAAAGGSALSLLPSIDRSEKPSSRIALSPNQRDNLISVYRMVFKSTADASNVGKMTSGFTGLNNNGNTCFMNATLQAIFHTNIVRRLFTQENFPPLCNVTNKMGTNGVMVAAISALFDLMWSGQFHALRITRFISLFSSEVNSSLTDGRQHDAHEFQTFLLDALHEDTNVGGRKSYEQNYKGGPAIQQEGADYERRNKLFADSPVQTVFYLHTVSELVCQSCGESSATFEESSCISLELPSASSTALMNSLNNHFSQVVLTGSEAWNCPRCKMARPAKRSTSIWKLPPVLVIHLKRFSYQGGGYVKNQIDVSFPLEGLDLRRHFHPHSPHRPTTLPYSLYSVTNHTGTLSSGHYTSVTSIDGSWTKCDDEALSPFNPANISPSGSYILFYKNQS